MNFEGKNKKYFLRRAFQSKKLFKTASSPHCHCQESEVLKEESTGLRKKDMSTKKCWGLG